jgi:hypothetical protein
MRVHAPNRKTTGALAGLTRDTRKRPQEHQ